MVKDFVAHGARRTVELFKGRWSVERLFSHGKELLMLDDLRVRGLEKVFIYVILAITAKLAVALAAVQVELVGFNARADLDYIEEVLWESHHRLY